MTDIEKVKERIEADYSADTDPDVFALVAELRRYESGIRDAKREIELAMMKSLHSQQWRHFSKAHSALILALGEPDSWPGTALKQVVKQIDALEQEVK